MLNFCRFMRDKRRLRTPSQISAREIRKLKDWVEDGNSSLLMAQGRGLKNSSLDFAVDFLGAIADSKAPIIWTLPVAFDGSPQLTNILRSLMLQSLSLSSNASHLEPNMITVQELRSATSVSHWLKLLERSFRRFKRLYVVIDMSLIERSAMTSQFEDCQSFDAEGFIEQLQTMVKARKDGCLKIILAMWPSNTFGQLLHRSSENSAVSTILTDRGLMLERKSWAPKLRGRTRMQMRVSSKYLRDAIGMSARGLEA
jgi:hypothetical protein